MEKITEFESLYESMLKCKNGKLHKNQAAHFYLNGIEECLKLEKELKNKSYEPRRVNRFMIYYPKKRQIASIAFRDRVYQRSLNDNALYPRMTKSFISGNCACQKRKGTDYARDKLVEYLKKYYRHHGNICYVGQFDIKSYYKEMQHSVVKEKFKSKLEPDIYNAVEKILEEQYEGDKGYDAGSQMVQIAGISVLDNLDHFIKERLKIKYYVRYMDDFVLIHHDKAYLEYCKSEIQKQLEDIGFQFNPKKTKVFRLKKLLFLGFNFKLTSSGKVIMSVDRDNVKHEKKKLRRLVKKVKNGELERKKVEDSFKSWKAHAGKGNSYKLICYMDKFYKELWRE